MSVRAFSLDVISDEDASQCAVSLIFLDLTVPQSVERSATTPNESIPPWIGNNN
jgi:hypothetical protein